MKRIVIFLVLLFSLTITYIAGQARGKRPFNLTKPQRKIIEIEEKKFSFLLYKYDPPYTHTKLLRSKEEADCSTPEGTDLALRSAAGRDKDWYLSLYDESGRKEMLRIDKKTAGKWLQEDLKGKSLPDDLTKTKHYSRFIYKVELEANDREYAVIQQKEVWEGEEEDYPSFKTFVRNGNVWLRTTSDDLEDHPVRCLVGLKSYDDFLKLSHRAIPIKLIFILIIITLMAAFLVIRLILKKKAITG